MWGSWPGLPRVWKLLRSTPGRIQQTLWNLSLGHWNGRQRLPERKTHTTSQDKLATKLGLYPHLAELSVSCTGPDPTSEAENLEWEVGQQPLLRRLCKGGTLTRGHARLTDFLIPS